MQAMGRKHAKAAAMKIALGFERAVIQIATTIASAQDAPTHNTKRVPMMVLARPGVDAMLVLIGRALPQQQKALAQNVLEENIQPLPTCCSVLRGMAAMLVNIGRGPASRPRVPAQHVQVDNIQLL